MNRACPLATRSISSTANSVALLRHDDRGAQSRIAIQPLPGDPVVHRAGDRHAQILAERRLGAVEAVANGERRAERAQCLAGEHPGRGGGFPRLVPPVGAKRQRIDARIADRGLIVDAATRDRLPANGSRVRAARPSSPGPSDARRIGLYSFAERTPDPTTGQLVSPAQRLRDLIETIELADQVGLDVFGLGEHHRPDFVSSAPAVILAMAAARTKTIRLTSAVTVLSSDDPVRVFQDFATLDLLSNGRAEIMAGRGSFIESFPLFGYDLHDYDALFAEKLDLLLKLRESERITWAGAHRAPLTGQGVYPRPLQNPLPVWVAVGGTPQSVVRAATLGLPMALAIIGGRPEQFVPLVNLYRQAGQQAGFGRRAVPAGAEHQFARLPGG